MLEFSGLQRFQEQFDNVSKTLHKLLSQKVSLSHHFVIQVQFIRELKAKVFIKCNPKLINQVSLSGRKG